MKNTDIYVDLYECTEEEIKTIFDLLPKPQFDDDYDITPRGGELNFLFYIVSIKMVMVRNGM